MFLNFIFIGNAGFRFEQSCYVDDGDEENNSGNGSGYDDDDIDEDRNAWH